MAFLIFWLLCGVVSAVVASNKGRNGCAWFIGGMLLGPIGIVLILVASPNEQGLVRSGTLKKCPYCAEMIKPEAKVCRYCGRELEPVQIVVSVPAVPPPPKQLPDFQNTQTNKAPQSEPQVRGDIVVMPPTTPMPPTTYKPTNNLFRRNIGTSRPTTLE